MAPVTTPPSPRLGRPTSRLRAIESLEGAWSMSRRRGRGGPRHDPPTATRTSVRASSFIPPARAPERSKAGPCFGSRTACNAQRQACPRVCRKPRRQIEEHWRLGCKVLKTWPGQTRQPSSRWPEARAVARPMRGLKSMLSRRPETTPHTAGTNQWGLACAPPGVARRDGGRAMRGSLGEKIGEGLRGRPRRGARSGLKLFKPNIPLLLSWHDRE